MKTEAAMVATTVATAATTVVMEAMEAVSRAFPAATTQALVVVAARAVRDL